MCRHGHLRRRYPLSNGWFVQSGVGRVYGAVIARHMPMLVPPAVYERAVSAVMRIHLQRGLLRSTAAYISLHAMQVREPILLDRGGVHVFGGRSLLSRTLRVKVFDQTHEASVVQWKPR